MKSLFSPLPWTLTTLQVMCSWLDDNKEHYTAWASARQPSSDKHDSRMLNTSIHLWIGADQWVFINHMPLLTPNHSVKENTIEPRPIVLFYWHGTWNHTKPTASMYWRLSVVNYDNKNNQWLSSAKLSSTCVYSVSWLACLSFLSSIGSCKILQFLLRDDISCCWSDPRRLSGHCIVVVNLTMTQFANYTLNKSFPVNFCHVI